MNKWQQEVHQSLLNSESAVIKELEKQYKTALREINDKVKGFQADINMIDDMLIDNGLGADERARLLSVKQSKIYQKQYQEALKGQVGGILDNMKASNYSTIDEYLRKSYQDGYIGTMYEISKQGIPIISPINQASVVKAVLTDSKVSEGLYTHLGVSVNKLKRTIMAEISRGISTGATYSDIARSIADVSGAPLSRTKTIARTEAHRIQITAASDAQYVAKDKGADVVKQWDSTLDGATRPSHRMVDGEIRELDESFSNGLMRPSDPNGSASEVINCRCALLTRARWALDEEELKVLKDRASYFGINKEDNFRAFEEKYIKSSSEILAVESNPYSINQGSLPPVIYEYQDYEEYREAVNKWKETHKESIYDYFVDNSTWSTSGLTEEQIDRIKRFDATIAKLQNDYPIYEPYAKDVHIGSFNGIKDSLTKVQQERMTDIAQAQFWFNTDEGISVIAFNPIGTKGNLSDDLLIRKHKIKNDEILLSVFDNSPEGYAIHEWGHGYTDYITQEMVYSNPTALEYWDWYKSLTKEEIKKGISAYAIENRAEFEAECFCELLTDNPRPIAKKFGEFLEKCKNSSLKRLEENAANSLQLLPSMMAVKKDTSSIKTVMLPKEEYAHVMSEIATNLTEAQKTMGVISKPIGKYVYTFENNGFGNYRIIDKKEIDKDVLAWWDE